MLLRRCFIWVAVMGALMLPAAAADSESAVLDAEKAWAKAVLRVDNGVLDRILADGLIYAHSSGAIESKTVYMSRLLKGLLKYTAIDHEQITVRLYGDAAVVHSIVVMAGSSDGSQFRYRLMMLHLWVKQDGLWRLAAHQTTRLTS